MEEGFSEDLLNLLQPLIDPRTTSSAPDDDIFCIAAPCIKCLYLIASGCDQLRQELSTNSDFLLGLFKGLKMHRHYIRTMWLESPVNNYSYIVIINFMQINIVGLLNHKDKNLLHCLSKFIISLVFVTLVRSDGAELKLPSAVVDRYGMFIPVSCFEYITRISTELSCHSKLRHMILSLTTLSIYWSVVYSLLTLY